MRASSFKPKKINGLAERANVQLDLFDHSVREHTVAARLLCIRHAPKARCMMLNREVRGVEIASQPEPRIVYCGTFWTVPSQTTAKCYAVQIDPPSCTCADFKKNELKCKHISAVEYYIVRGSGGAIPEVPEQLKRKTYRQEWRSYTQAQVNEKAKFLELLYALCETIDEPPQHMGRPRVPLADRIFACMFKVYSTLSGRRFMSDLREVKQRGLITTAPNFCSISRFLESEDLTPVLKRLITESSLPLKSVESEFAVDASGFSIGTYQRWANAKWGDAVTVDGEKQPNKVSKKEWIKAHVMCGVKTNVVTSVEITDGHAGDSPRFKPLVDKTSESFAIKSVCADKAYSAEKNLKLVLLKGGQPYIAFKSNSTATNPRTGQVWKRLFLQYQYDQEEFMNHYHKRSNVETTFSMIKRKFGERLRSKTYTAQTNEVLCKILAHNLCVLIQSMYELGVEVTFASTSASDANVG
jgi:transposase